MRPINEQEFESLCDQVAGDAPNLKRQYRDSPGDSRDAVRRELYFQLHRRLELVTDPLELPTKHGYVVAIKNLLQHYTQPSFGWDSTLTEFAKKAGIE